MRSRRARSERRAHVNLWYPAHRRSFWLIPEGVELPRGSLRLINLRGEERFVDVAHLEPFNIRPAEAERLLGDEFPRPGFSAEAKARRAHLDPSVSSEEWSLRAYELAKGYIPEEGRELAESFFRYGEWGCAIDIVEDRLSELDEALPRVVVESLSDALVALGEEPLDLVVWPIKG